MGSYSLPYFNSSAIKRAEYDASAMRLKLWFPDDGPYDFCRVPQHIYDGLLKAVSKGKYYNDYVRDNYQC